MKFFTFFLLLLNAFGFLTAMEEEERACSQEGKQMQLDSAWYECRLAKYVPVGCITPSGARIDIEQSYINKELLMKCTQTSPSSIAWKMSGCFSNGRILKPGDTTHDDTFWYLCSQQGEVLKVQMPGCLGTNDQVVNAGGEVIKGSYVYKCDSGSDGKLLLSPSGCLLNNKQYSLEEEIETADGYWYKCSSSGTSSLNIEMMGCIKDGKKIKDGDVFTENGFQMTCKVKPVVGQTALSEAKRGMSCMELGPSGTFINHAVGETWTAGQAPIKYIIQCTQENLTISKSIIKCFYEGPEGQGEVDTGCYKKFGNTILQCSIKDFKNVQAQIINQAGDATETQLNAKGFRNC